MFKLYYFPKETLTERTIEAKILSFERLATEHTFSIALIYNLGSRASATAKSLAAPTRSSMVASRLSKPRT